MKLQNPSISLRRFSLAYEDLPAFHAAYIMLVLVFAGLCNLGFFACLIAAHVALDFYKYRVHLGYNSLKAFRGVVRGSLIDIALLFLAISTFVYLNPSLDSIRMLNADLQLRVTIMRGLAILLPKLTILHHSLRIAFDLPSYMQTPHTRIRKPFGIIEYVSLSTLFIALALLAVASGVLGLDMTQFGSMLAPELLPWRF
ncbi:MAG TPA: hypothetical protein VHA78_00225 [Candidatus Peribacteraceae bacterium]|nr:hypothetical protein [Candidatus Peribacteraceae bacterium]